MNATETKPWKEWLAHHIFTPSELETYLLCPYRFYARSFLKLMPETTWEVEMTPAETGNLIHRILERFLKSQKDILLLMDEEITVFAKDRPRLSRVLLDRHRKRIERTLLAFLEQDFSGWSSQKTLQPRHLEWSFGDKTNPLEIASKDGPPIRIRGRIDRIDVDETNKRFLVIDYKTGSKKITGGQILAGESLQLPLYILAVQRLLLPGYEPIGGLYYHLSDMSKKDGLLHADRLPPFLEIHPRSSSLVPGARWEASFEFIEQRVRDIVDRILNTEPENFESHSEPCEPYCPYQDICRIRANPSQARR